MTIGELREPVTSTEGTGARKPRLLDLFCKAGGCTKGYQRAGFYVVGVDIEPQPNYCGDEFFQADALEVLTDLAFVQSFAAIHASPPCQRWATAGADRALADEHPDLLTPTRELLKQIGLPWIIENVPGAPMPTAFLLCGATFGLPVVRHRLFETSFNVGLVPSLCHQREWGRAVDHGPGFAPYARGSWEARWRKEVLPTVWPWMTLKEAGQAIPPAYCEWIGTRLVEHLGALNV